MSSFEQTAPAPVQEPSGDGNWTGPAPRSAALVARRSAFTGRVTYVDPQSVRALRSRVPRPILASASLMAVAVGLAVSTAGGPATTKPSISPTLVSQPSEITVAPLEFR